MELTIASLLATPTLAATLGAWVGSAAERTRWAGPGLKDGFTLAELGFDQRQNFGGFYAGELIAFAQMGPRHGCLHLSRVIIHPQWRGKGLGRLWLQQLMATSPDATFGLNLYPDNLAAIGCYQSLGFAPWPALCDHPGVLYYRRQADGG